MALRERRRCERRRCGCRRGARAGWGGSERRGNNLLIVERPITTVDRRVDFALIDDEGQSILVRTMVPIIQLTLSVPSSPQPVPRFPPELAQVENAARAMVGEPCYRECFLLPDTVVDVDLVAREVMNQAASGYRDAPSAGYEAVSIQRLVEVEEGAAGLPISATVSRHVVRWIKRLFR